MIHYPEKRAKVLNTGKGKKNTTARVISLAVALILFASAGFYLYKVNELKSYSLATLKIDGLYCPSCPPRVKAAIESVPGVIKADVDLSTNSALVYFDSKRTDPQQFVAAIAKAGTGGYKGEVLIVKERAEG
ncbi:MAG: heavy-metal-associated domain-containing protein [Candidatus Schekmanbacteria bacterium]|nr:heavy-metal-associated domain-containing protein [Candidatus Schekmanbacteria bacterium]